MSLLNPGPILIAGGGIGGLALALGLARAGRESVVLEARPQFGTAGAGIQLGPNGVRVLSALGVSRALQPLAGQPEAIAVFRGDTGRRITDLPLGGWIAHRHGAPYWVVHRADLHDALRAAAERNPLITLRTGFTVRLARRDVEGLRVQSDAETSVTGAALVGADGLWSAVRRMVAPEGTPVFAGASASRCVLPAEAAGALPMNAVGIWLSPSAHVVHYPVRGGRELAVVVIAKEAWESRAWDVEADRAHVLGKVVGFHSSLRAVLERAAQWRRWSLHKLPQLSAWSRDRVVLMGDAAHPMFPYLAQGGVMALEDAWCLARAIGASRGVEERAIEEFVSERKARAAKVQAASARNGRIYHMAPPLSLARDAVLGAVPGHVLMSRLDWLYGWGQDVG